MENYYYLIIDLATISIPLWRSFDSRANFYKRWPDLFLGIAVMSLLFIPWDIAFTSMGVWGFNPAYLTGLKIANLPVEEWLFFISIPYACLFIYEAMNYFIEKDILGKAAPIICYLLIPLLLLIGFTHLDQWYTSVTFLLTAALLAYVAFILKPSYLGRFFVAYFISLIPFFIVNGLLTGSWIPDQIVWYNDAENLGIRLGTIPVEDSIYMMLMLLIVTMVYERNSTVELENQPVDRIIAPS